MELLNLEAKLVEYKWRDVTFLVNAALTTGKKWNLVIASRVTKENHVEFSPWEYYTNMVKNFVVGWKGVTENGKDVPYSFETFMERLPSSVDENLVMQLGSFIAQEVGFMEKEADLKNGSGGPSNG